MADKTWLCERDDEDAIAPFRATMLLDNHVVASARGVDEMTAFAHLADLLASHRIADGGVLGFQRFMCDWTALTRRSG
jgi:hypothetical protein